MPKASKVKKKVSKSKTVNKTKPKSLSKTKNTQKSPIKISNISIPKIPLFQTDKNKSLKLLKISITKFYIVNTLLLQG